VFAVALGAWGCGGVQPSKETLSLRAARERLFEENLAGYQRQDPDETAALVQLAHYHDAQETFDLAALTELLGPEFELRYYTTDDRLQIQDRSTFLDKRRGWTRHAERPQRLVISAKASYKQASGGRVALTALTTYKSKYFNPRFLEVFVFGKHRGSWLLERIFMYPMLPPRPELYEPLVFQAEYLTSKRSLIGLDSAMVVEGPDRVLDRMARLSVAPKRSERGRQGPLVIFFKEPPPDGTAINVVETQLQGFGRTPRGNWSPYTSSVTVQRNGNPYYFLLGAGWFGFNYDVSVEVTVSGVRVAETYLNIQ
jgi:hypothetical protein